jgi:site-specific DNA-methyltransferase (adenine-specific)
MTDVLRESLRVVKPGGYALVWSLPRTSHWTAWALEEAGWEVRDSVMHVFLQGMPKSLDASKALDRLAGAERPVVGKAPWSQPAISGHHGGLGHSGVRFASEGRFTPDVTSPTTRRSGTAGEAGSSPRTKPGGWPGSPATSASPRTC